MKKLFLLGLISLNCFAVSESNYHLVYEAYESKGSFESKTFIGKKGLKISYMKYGAVSGSNGPLIVAVGRNESTFKYLEVAMDLYNSNFSPIYITAHRGQGNSDRALDHLNKGYVRKFKFYVDDLKTLHTIVKNENPNKKIAIIGHSLGGAIALAHMQKYPTDFSKAVLAAPMLKIALEKGERDALLKTALACLTPFKPYCTDYIPNGKDPSPQPDYTQSDVTSSKVRHDFTQYLFKDNPRTKIGDATLRWVKESVKATRNMRKTRNIRKVKAPILMIQATEDTVVDNQGEDEVCDKLKSLCEMKVIHGSKHNVYMEADKFRDQVMDSTIDFLK